MQQGEQLFENKFIFRLAAAVVTYRSSYCWFLVIVLHQEATRFGLFTLHQGSILFASTVSDAAGKQSQADEAGSTACIAVNHVNDGRFYIYPLCGPT
jgi:hypothetical protein